MGGVVGPAGFVAAWVGAGVATRGYSPVHDAISELASVHAPTRTAMTAGLVCFGAAVPAYAAALRVSVPGRAWIAAATTGVATLGVAAFPLHHSPAIDTVHGACAAVGYASLALTPLLAARSLAGRWATASTAVGVLAGACLAATVLGPAHGFFQRAGLTIGDVWLAASAVALLRAGVVGRITDVGPNPSDLTV